ncbi:MAG: hypothetical protein IKJ45_07650 [Kiritimatiellae bacterium]|nr:hypothetical protein [Kiritimatiellia bacterium]
MADEPKPEERARVKIDEQFVDAGWHIADRSHFTYDHNATALTEGLLDGNHEADYLLFVDGKVIGVLEAKRSDIDLESAAGGQTANYAHIIPEEYPRWNDEPRVVLLATVFGAFGAISTSVRPGVSTTPSPAETPKLTHATANASHRNTKISLNPS